MIIKTLEVLVLLLVTAESHRVNIEFSELTRELKLLPRFWTNTGFAPPAPVENVTDFFESKDVNLNLEIIGSLPNKGISNVRIHWLLNLLSISNYTQFDIPVYDFQRLDSFLWSLINDYQLLPTIEIMKAGNMKRFDGIVWEDLTYQLLSRYIEFYGLKNVLKWKFETWNEPDLKSYNLLNFTLNGYKEYMHGLNSGLRAAERQFSLNKVLKLHGPAGLFKDKKKHPFCWGVLEECNLNPEKCPIDVITFHRKGNGGKAEEIVRGGQELINEVFNDFKNLTKLQYSNTEADPIKKWSEPRAFQADVRYAAILTETVMQQWQAIFNGSMKNLESISHDNSFLNYYPNVFTQRTLLARFQINNTTPQHLQFIQKPVYTALGLLGNFAQYAGEMKEFPAGNISVIVSSNGGEGSFYSCIIITSSIDAGNFTESTENLEFAISNLPQSESLSYFVEAIDNKRTNPSLIYENSGSKSFPDINNLKAMRAVGNPIILEQPNKVIDGKIIFNSHLNLPFVISIRICSHRIKRPKKVSNLRLRIVNEQEILLFWSDSFYKKRCIKTYEIFFKYSQENYHKIETNHIPFLYHQLHHTIPGCFKVRSKDILGRFSKLSKKLCYNGSERKML
ncbi:unnamed protein product [Diamesa hyperborea]